MRRLFAITIFTICLAGPLAAQHTHDHHGHDHGYHHSNDNPKGHFHERNEIGISAGALYGLDDKVWGPGIHVHYFRTLSEHSRWSAGGFAEYAWLDNGHYSVGAGIKWEPVERLNIGIFPGLLIGKHTEEHHGHSHDHGWKTHFSAHFELVYDLFHWDKFHLGPAFDYSWSRHDSHIMLGVHAAVCF